MKLSLRVKWALGFGLLAGLAHGLTGGIIPGTIVGGVVTLGAYLFFWYNTLFYWFAEYVMKKLNISLIQVSILFALVTGAIQALAHPELVSAGLIPLLIAFAIRIGGMYVNLLIIGAILA